MSIDSNLEGQAMGRKGQETRARLLNVALELLDTTPLREIRAADLARKALISPANFYLYFENVEALVLNLAERAAEEASVLLEPLQGEWSWSTGADDHVTAFARAYFDFWDSHRSILRVRNLAADEGNWTFQKARMHISVPMHQAIAAKIEDSRSKGLLLDGPHALTLASLALASLERSASNYLMFPPKYGVTRERLIEASVYMLKTIALGPEPAM